MKRVWLAERPLALAVLIGFGLWLFVQLLARTLWVWFVVLLAVLLATSMQPLVKRICRLTLPPGGWRLPRALAVLLIYALAAALLGLGVYFVGARLITELVDLVLRLPDLGAQLAAQARDLVDKTGIPMSWLPGESQLASQLSGLTARAISVLQFAGSFAGQLATLLFRAFLVLALALFLVVESEQIARFWVSLFPPARRARVSEVSAQMGDKMGSWLLGQLAVIAIIGVLAGLGAWLLGLPFPVLLGVATALIDLIPMLGPSVMILPAVLIGLSHSTLTGILAGLLFLTLSELEAHVLGPLITGRVVKLSPTLIIVALPLGLALYGPIGALLAVPVAAALQVFVREVVLPWLWDREGVAEEDRQVEDARPEVLAEQTEE